MRTLRTSSWLLLLPALLASGCSSAPAPSEVTPFDETDNDDEVGAGVGGKSDEIAGYRSGCSGPIRTGTYALRGDVVTPAGVLKKGWVLVDGERIVGIKSSRQKLPEDLTVRIDTGGVIFPGLIDGHNHVEYNVLPLLDLGKRFDNRNQWPRKVAYTRGIKEPRAAVKAAGLVCEAIKHGEVRALVGGTTSIQGAPYKPCVRPLVRNVEQTNFCRDKVRTNTMAAVSFGKGDPSFTSAVHKDLEHDKLDAFVVHIAEGIDETSRAEWDILEQQALVVPELIIVHGTALGADELAEAARVGAKLVWSPLSNFYLYGETTDVPEALRAGLLVSLGADWNPSGSANVLAELKVADRVNRDLWDGVISDEELVAMVTTNPALAFGVDGELGSIEIGKYADLMVVARRTDATPHRTLIEARPQDVLLVTIAGDPLFGTEPLMAALGKGDDLELVDACGAPRAIDVTIPTDEFKDVPGGADTLASIDERLGAVLPQLTPVFDCTDEAASRAFAGTPLE